jgi:pimeloyl-ACP methyl ester carboxylesterase
VERSSSGALRFATRGHSRIAYDPGEAGSARPVALLLHDLLGDRNQFAALRAGMAAQTRTIAPDARGHGASATLLNQWYSAAELADDALAVLDAEAVERALVIGHGLGGATALELARRTPRRVAGLVLIEPALYAVLDNDRDPSATRLRDERRVNDRAAADAAYKELTERALDLYIQPRWGDDWRASMPKPRSAAIRRQAGALTGLLPALDGQTIPKPELALIDRETLIVTGYDAQAIDRLTADRLAFHIPRAQSIQIPFGPRGIAPFHEPAELLVALSRMIDRTD